MTSVPDRRAALAALLAKYTPSDYRGDNPAFFDEHDVADYLVSNGVTLPETRGETPPESEHGLMLHQPSSKCHRCDWYRAAIGNTLPTEPSAAAVDAAMKHTNAPMGLDMDFTDAEMRDTLRLAYAAERGVSP